MLAKAPQKAARRLFELTRKVIHGAADIAKGFCAPTAVIADFSISLGPDVPPFKKR